MNKEILNKLKINLQKLEQKKEKKKQKEKEIVCSNIDREKLYRTLLSDGLDCSYYGYPTKGLTMNIKLNELKKIQMEHEKQKKLSKN